MFDSSIILSKASLDAMEAAVWREARIGDNPIAYALWIELHFAIVPEERNAAVQHFLRTVNAVLQFVREALPMPSG
jgi:hypothetical protein